MPPAGAPSGTAARIAAPERPVAPARDDPISGLRAWVQSHARRGDPPDARASLELRDLLDGLGERLRGHPDEAPDADLALLDLAALGRSFADVPDQGPGMSPAEVLEEAQTFLRRRLEGAWAAPAGPFLADQVLADPRRNSPERRREAALALVGRYLPETRTALLAAAKVDLPEVADAARDALSGWPDPVVHRYFLELLEAGEHVHEVVQHLQKAGATLDEPLRDRLRAGVGRLYLATDWRQAARAGQVVRALDDQRAVPLLLEALELWHRRTEAGEGSRRIVEELVVELRRRSGRGMGDDPDVWERWWADVLAGRVLLPDQALARGEPLTRADFFGLRLATDRVLFVVDRSGSMENGFGTDGRSRYQEAIEQLFHFLEASGPSTRFGLVLFHDRADRWKTHLVPADEPDRRRARRWLEGKRPQGGTQLRLGLFKALDCDDEGHADPAEVEADTVVVLCDGATAEGPSWVARWLRSTQDELEVVVHAVQIGSGGDGTLQALAEGTGGTFVRIQP